MEFEKYLETVEQNKVDRNTFKRNLTEVQDKILNIIFTFFI